MKQNWMLPVALVSSMLLWLIIGLFFMVITAHAQYIDSFTGQPTNGAAPQTPSYTFINPGHAPVPIQGDGNGGYTIHNFGSDHPLTYVTPNGNGGYTVTTPGEAPRYIQPNQ